MKLNYTEPQAYISKDMERILKGNTKKKTASKKKASTAKKTTKGK